MIMPRLLQKGSAQKGTGFLKVILTVWLSDLVDPLDVLVGPEVVAAVAGSAAYSQLKTTSSAVKGLPSCHATFFLSRQVTERPSLLTRRSARSESRRRGWHQVAVGLEGGQRLVEDARAVLVLGAHGEVGVEECRRLPPEHLEGAAASALGGGVRRLRLGLGEPRRREHLVHEGCRQAEPQHGLHERPAGEPASLDLGQQSSQFSLVHRRSSLIPARLARGVPTSGRCGHARVAASGSAAAQGTPRHVATTIADSAAEAGTRALPSGGGYLPGRRRGARGGAPV